MIKCQIVTAPGYFVFAFGRVLFFRLIALSGHFAKLIYERSPCRLNSDQTLEALGQHGDNIGLGFTIVIDTVRNGRT